MKLNTNRYLISPTPNTHGRNSMSLFSLKRLDLIKDLIKAGADVNARDENGDTPLHFHTNIDVLKVLIDSGADVNARNTEGCTALHFSNRKVMTFLISAGSDVNARTETGNTPLHTIMTNAHWCVKILIDAGADVNAINNFGNTPLHFAQNFTSTKHLIDAGADVNVKNSFGCEASVYNVHIKPILLRDVSSRKITRFIRNCKWLKLYRLTRTFAFNKWYCGEEDGNGGGVGRKVDHKRIMDTFAR